VIIPGQSEFDDRAGRLLYANCGHRPALVLRHAGEVERLEPTATVLGLFSTWECRTAELQLSVGDLLAIYTDGITETFDAHDDGFGKDDSSRHCTRIVTWHHEI